MSVYTIILEYDGATYITQVEASDVQTAMRAWSDEQDIYAIDGFPLNEADRILTSLAEQTPTPVNKLTNVWSVTFVVGHDLAILHLIKTEAKLDS
ncbi:hypothetical protein [Photobacterium sp. J15]|uniref:hypothetical protein n=1 Tax=Photobacterium sp. J15 TaxID=265901 RepID=UPI0007E37108|nr:hypothetical protein [Photobacterium sp. J15]